MRRMDQRTHMGGSAAFPGTVTVASPHLDIFVPAALPRSLDLRTEVFAGVMPDCIIFPFLVTHVRVGSCMWYT